MSDDVEDALLAQNVISGFVRKGVKLLALDFDRTIISIHTKGRWEHETFTLAKHVRPCFRELILAALDSSLYICVVTYSTQGDLIRDVLRNVLPTSDVSRILICAYSPEWTLGKSSLGKQQHLASIITELFNRDHAMIHSAEVVLMDDDTRNVQMASEFGHQSFEVDENVSLQRIWDFVDELEVQLNLPVTPIE